MLSENLKNLRKQKGYSQATLAEQLNVVRQTVSKWEQGLSVPDAEMLQHIAELFEVPVSELLGEPMAETKEKGPSLSEVAQQLAILNDQMAAQNRHRKFVRRVILGILGGILVLFLALILLVIAARMTLGFRTDTGSSDRTHVEIECQLDGETYNYSVYYDENHQIREAGGSVWIANHVNTEKYDDADVLLAQIEDYFVDHGGTYKVILEEEIE